MEPRLLAAELPRRGRISSPWSWPAVAALTAETPRLGRLPLRRSHPAAAPLLHGTEPRPLARSRAASRRRAAGGLATASSTLRSRLRSPPPLTAAEPPPRSGLGMSYKLINVCGDNCMLFWKNGVEKLSHCKRCGKSRYVEVLNEEGESTTTKNLVKQLLHMPITARLKRLYMSKETTHVPLNYFSTPITQRPSLVDDYFSSMFYPVGQPPYFVPWRSTAPPTTPPLQGSTSCAPSQNYEDLDAFLNQSGGGGGSSGM